MTKRSTAKEKENILYRSLININNAFDSLYVKIIIESIGISMLGFFGYTSILLSVKSFRPKSRNLI